MMKDFEEKEQKIENREAQDEFSQDIIEEIEAGKRKNGVEPAVDLTGELIPILIERGEKVQAFLTDSFWYDVGSLERYEKLENYVVQKFTRAVMGTNSIDHCARL